MAKKPTAAARLLEPLGRAGARNFSPLTWGSAQAKASALGYCFVEGVHFDLAYTNPQEVGHKAVAIALSQIAARGLTPERLCLSLGLTQTLNEPFAAEFLHGLRTLADEHAVGVELGHVFPSPTVLIITLTVVAKNESAKQSPREGPRNGDYIAVTGSLGASAAGLTCLRKLGRGGSERHAREVKAHLRPEPRVREALSLYASKKITALTDLSEGLATEIHELLGRSQLGAEIDETALPVSPGTRDAALMVTSNARLWALYGSEDYELLMTFRPAAWPAVRKILSRRATALTVIGRVTEKNRTVILNSTAGDRTPLAPRAWNPLVRRRP